MDDAVVGPAIARPGSTVGGDAGLLAAIAKGDEQAFAQLYDRYARLAYAIALGVCGEADAAEEAVAEAFISVWRAARTYEPARGEVAVWLSAVFRNRALDERRRRRRPALALDERSSPATDPGPGVDAKVDVRSGLAALEPDERRVIGLAYFGGLTQREIAAKTGFPLARVRSLTRRALEALAASLG